MLGFGKKTDKELRQLLAEEQKEQKENHLKWYLYLLSLMFVLVGAVFIAYVEIDVPFICMFMACVFAVAGIISIISYCVRDVATGYYRLDLVYGVIAAFAALIFYTKQDVVGVYFPIIAGFILFANGVVKLQHSIDMKRIDRKMKKVTEIWLVVMIFALVCIAAGFITVYMTPENSRTMFVFTGIAFIVAGASDVFTHIVFNSKVRVFRSGDYLTVNDKDKDEDKDKNGEKEAEVENRTDTEEPREYEEPDPGLYVSGIAEENETEETVVQEASSEEITASDATDPQT